MRSARWLVGIGLFSAACVLVLAERRVGRAEAEIDRMKRSVPYITEKVNEVEEMPRPPPTVIAAEQKAAVAAAVATEGQGLAPSDPSSTSPTETSLESQKAFLEHSFSTQAPDASWSRKARAEVNDIFQPLTNQDTRLVSADCRSTLCRIELVHPTEEGFHAFMTTAMNGGMRGWKGPGSGGMLQTDPDGTVRTVFYLAKEGTELPMLD
jgi:hypothetical protein